MSARQPTPFDSLFDALEERMRVPHITSADATPSQRDRVVWERADGGLEPQALGFRSPNKLATGKLAHPYTVAVHAATDLEVSERVAQFLGHLDKLLGPKQGQPQLGSLGDPDYQPERLGYAAKAGKSGPKGGDGTAAGYACEVAVTLYTLVVSEYRPPATIGEVLFTVSATTDSAPEVGVAHP